MKYIFVTGGVVSGLGKGICAASLGRLLKQCGYDGPLVLHGLAQSQIEKSAAFLKRAMA